MDSSSTPAAGSPDAGHKSREELLAELAALRQEHAALRQEHEQLQLTLDRVADGVTVQDASGAVVYANDSAAQLCGYPSAKAFLAAPPGEVWQRFELLDDDGRPFPLDKLPGRMVLAGVLDPPETTVCFRIVETGARHWSTIRSTPLLAADGSVSAVINSWHDVTALKQHQLELQEQREYFAVTLTSIGDAVIVTDDGGAITFLNPGAEGLTGWTSGEAAGQPLEAVFRIINEESRQPVESPVVRVLREGQVVGLANHTLLLHRDGREIPIDDSGAPIRAADGTLIGVVLVFRDVTERKHQETMQRFLLDASAALASSLNYQSTLVTIAQQSVPVLADWCGVEMLDDAGQPQRLAIVHSDPAKVALAQELLRRYPSDPKASNGLFHVLRTGQPELVPEVPDALLEGAAQDPEHLRMLREVGLKSYMIVPLVARERVLGAITLVSAESGRRYTAEDLALASDLAARAAIAVDNARLHERAQQELRHRSETEQQLRLITDNLPVLISYVDAEQRYQFMNQEYERWFGRPRSQVIGGSLWEVLGKKGYEQVRGYVRRALAGEVVTFQTRVAYQVVGVRTVEATYVPDRDEHGVVRGFFALVVDVTQRKQDEESLLLQSHVLDCMSEGVSIANEHGIILYTNPAENAMFGYAQGELVGQHVTVQNAYPAEENFRIVSQVMNELRRNGIWRGNFQNRRKDGTPFTTYAHITRLDLGERYYLVCVQEDVTEQKRIEAERTQLLMRERHSRQAAEAALSLRDQFLSLAAHELKTPMTTILGSAQLIQRQIERNEQSSERERNRAGTMVGQIQRLNRLISSLLDLTRIQEGRFTLAQEPLDLCAVVEQIVAEVQPTVSLHRITLTTTPEPCVIRGDRLRLEQVLQNLIQNAIKYSPEGGPVDLRIERRGAEVCLRVEDQGIGIPADELARVFDRFFRARNVDTGQLSGMGIGLYVVHEIVTLHGGTILVESAEGAGSSFIVSLPLLEEDAAA